MHSSGLTELFEDRTNFFPLDTPMAIESLARRELRSPIIYSHWLLLGKQTVYAKLFTNTLENADQKKVSILYHTLLTCTTSNCCAKASLSVHLFVSISPARLLLSSLLLERYLHLKRLILSYFLTYISSISWLVDYSIGMV